MKICTMKVDSSGRITIPKTFLNANKLRNCYVFMETINSNSNAVRLTFTNESDISSYSLEKENPYG